MAERTEVSSETCGDDSSSSIPDFLFSPRSVAYFSRYFNPSLLLYEQGVLKKKGDSYYSALKSGSLNSYDFIRKKLKSLQITPAQLGMDPCSCSVVITDSKTGKVKAGIFLKNRYVELKNKREKNK